MRARRRSTLLIAAGVLLGLGLGGMADSILLHEILQWHHLLSAEISPTTIAGLETNVRADGIFNAVTWALTAAGLAALWSAARRPGERWSTSTFAGALAAGWGLFNLVEGVIDHHLLGIHHVRPGPQQLAWDLGYLALGAILLLAGMVLLRAEHRAVEAQPGAGRRAA